MTDTLAFPPSPIKMPFIDMAVSNQRQLPWFKSWY